MTPAGSWETLTGLEWLESNGLGGYASGTESGVGTRGYHGLLAAALGSPAERMLMVTTCEEWIAGDSPVYLSAHQYPGTVFPDGWRRVDAFRAAPMPTWTFAVGAARVERRVFMVHGENTTVVRYRVAAGPALQLCVRPFFVFRDHHGRRAASDRWTVTCTRTGNVVHCAPSDGGHALSLHFGAAAYRDDAKWYRQFEYLREMERGLDYREDAFAPFVVELSLAPGAWADLIFSAEPRVPREAAALEDAELTRRTATAVRQPADDIFGRRLALAADAFLVARGASGGSVIAGYPWFGDWGRDAMISLPGLALATGRVEEAGRILATFAEAMQDGLLPNRFSDAGVEPEYNTVDASLWFAVALHHFRACGGDASLVEGPLAAALERIVAAYSAGTRWGIREDADGLITAGQDGVALTWMDAREGGWVVTPRRGKAVEINALWYNALLVLAELQLRRGRERESAALKVKAERTRAGFLAAFWDERAGACADVIGPDGARDASLRPNQLFAASLPFPLVSREQAGRMLAKVSPALLTRVGLRTLAPADPQYRGRCTGSPAERDAAYHQGSVWPWLIGPYVDASLYAGGDTPAMRAKLRELFTGLQEHLEEACVGQISEIFDGEEPHAPRGCVAQAWSVAETLRAWQRITSRRPRPSAAVAR